MLVRGVILSLEDSVGEGGRGEEMHLKRVSKEREVLNVHRYVANAQEKESLWR